MAIINGKNVKIPELDYGFEAFLEDYGTPVLGAKNATRAKSLRFIGNCVAYALKIEPEDAFTLLNQHVLAGGKIDKISEEIGEAIEGSGFLTKFAENYGAETPKKVPAKAKAEKTEE